MMFLKLQKPRINIRTLSDLPEFTSTQNVQVPESNDHNQESTELSPLPPMCDWCLRRKPSDYSKLYDEVIQQELQADRSVSEQRAHQSFVKGNNSISEQRAQQSSDNSLHTGIRCTEKGGKSVQTGIKCTKGESYVEARNSNFRREGSSIPNSNIDLTSVYNNPILAENRHMEKGFSSSGKQTEKANYNIPGSEKTQALSVQTQPGNVKTLKYNLKTQADNVKTCPENSLARPPPLIKQVQSVERKNSNIQEAVTTSVRTGPTAHHTGRTNTTRSLQQPETVINKAVPITKLTGRPSNTPQHPITTGITAAFKGGNPADMDTEKSDASKQATESHAVQCCPLCQTTFAAGATQMDVDGHIALCLSMSGDDAAW